MAGLENTMLPCYVDYNLSLQPQVTTNIYISSCVVHLLYDTHMDIYIYVVGRRFLYIRICL